MGSSLFDGSGLSIYYGEASPLWTGLSTPPLQDEFQNFPEFEQSPLLSASPSTYPAQLDPSPLPSLSLNGNPVSDHYHAHRSHSNSLHDGGWEVVPRSECSRTYPGYLGMTGDHYSNGSPTFMSQPLSQTPPEHARLLGLLGPRQYPSGSAPPMSRTDSAISNESRTSSSSYDSLPDSAPQGAPESEFVEKPLRTTRARKGSGSSVDERRKVGKAKGRKGGLSEEAKAHAAQMRKVGACASCKRRRAKCDHETPCLSCVRYYRERLSENPCRGRQLEDLANEILCENVFPRGQLLEQRLGSSYRIDPNEYTVLLELGFGAALPVRVKIVEPTVKSQPLVHKHVVYPWQPSFIYGQSGLPQKFTEDALVFPAILANTTDLESVIENHLSCLLENRENFAFFPLYRSPLAVLRHIWVYYKDLPDNFRTPLGLALKLLILIHIGGDTRIKDDPISVRLMRKYHPSFSETANATPCFIRSQLGPVFCALAGRMLRDVLNELERLSLSRDSSRFGLIVATFAVLFMAIESQQYHTAKEPYHGGDPVDAFDANDLDTRDLDEFKGAGALLNCYRVWFPGCQAQLKGATAGGSGRSRASSMASPASNNSIDVSSATFFASLTAAIDGASAYLKERAAVKVAPKEDMNVFFDRLLGRLFLMKS